MKQKMSVNKKVGVMEKQYESRVDGECMKGVGKANKRRQQILKLGRNSTKKIKMQLWENYIKKVQRQSQEKPLEKNYQQYDLGIFIYQTVPQLILNQINYIQFQGILLLAFNFLQTYKIQQNMRLNVPPTLKQSSLMDSHSLSVGSPINLNSRGFKRSSKAFKEDDNNQFEDDMTIGQMVSNNSKKQTYNLLPPEFITSMKRKTSIDYEDDTKMSEASFLKRMPLFNQYEEESNFSEIRLSEIPKKQLDYQDQFNLQELSKCSPTRLNRKSSSGDTQTIVEKSPETLTKGLKRLKSIDTINEESISSPGNSLNSSNKIQPRTQLVSSLRKTNIKAPQQVFQLQPIQQYNKQKHGIAQSSSSHSKTNESSARIARQIQQIKNENIIQMSEVESERQITNSNPSDKSCSTIHINDQYGKFEGKTEIQSKKDNRIKQKMRQIQKSFQQNDDYSMWDLQLNSPMTNLRNQFQKSPKNVPLKGQDERLITNINKRYQRIKQMKYGKSQEKQTPKPSQSAKKVTFQGYQLISEQKSIQTDPSFGNYKISEQSIKQFQKRYANQIQQLQRENKKLQKQAKMDNDTIKCLQGVKLKYEEENKFLMEKIKRLERILQRNEKELTEWKEFAKQGRVQPSQTAKQNKIVKQMNLQWRQKEDRYLARITQLEKQLKNAHLYPKDINQKQPQHQEFSKSPKHNQKYYEHIEKLNHYEQNLKRNMQIIRREQEKIIHQWRLIDQFHQGLRQSQNHEQYQFQTTQRQEPQTKHVNTVSFRFDSDHYFKDNDVASISAKLKSIRSQLAGNLR